MEVEKIMQELERKHPGELEYLQAVREVLMSVKDVYNQHPEFVYLNNAFAFYDIYIPFDLVF